VMSFTRHANDRRGHRVSGLSYSAGVVLSFLALGALMLGLRSAGEQLGWGFQLQSPAVVAALATLFTVMGLNLAGLFEFGQFLPSRVLLLEAKNPAINAFLSGVLAVAIASPCTAPFMGASLGLALALPALQALLIFTGIGVGMALPYLAASLMPALARALPRPGAWMDTFRRAMAFPMFATVVWLLWVLGQQSGIDGAAALLALLVAFSGVLWALTLTGRSRLVLASLSIAVLALLLGAIGRNVTRPLEFSATSAVTDRWQPWAPGRVEQALASGTPVFVDFTAAWCVTCQYNKKTTLANVDVLADLKAKKVTLLRADWTRRDPAISAALSQLGRSGVPLYVLYQAGRAPLLLSEILTVPDLRSALAAL
ncbi:MAG: thioredoxin family protein, partial [Rhodoferax sp.]|nr:thioredoxin family protein [Rhodoferax sp.]